MPSTRQTAEIETRLREIADRNRARSGVDVLDLLRSAVSRLVARSMDGHDAEAFTFENDGAFIEDVSDWLTEAVVNDVPWLANVDGNGVPRKFSKFSKLADIKDEIARSREKARRSRTTVALVPGEELLVAELAEGFSIVRLMSAGALRRESDVMQHCVGEGGYTEGVRTGKIRIMSLRDPAGNPHATLEVDPAEMVVRQLRGKQNKMPIRKYMDLIVPWIAASAYKVQSNELGGGYVQTGDRGIVHISDLGESEEISGNVTLHQSDGEPFVLPKGLHVDGSLELRSSGGEASPVELPEGLRVERGLKLSNCLVSGLANVAARSIYVRGGAIRPLEDPLFLPMDVEMRLVDPAPLLGSANFGGDLRILHALSVEIPEGFSIEGDMYLHSVANVTIGDGARFGGLLNIEKGNPDSFDAPPVGMRVGIGSGVSVIGEFEQNDGSLSIGDDFKASHTLSLKNVDFEGIGSSGLVGAAVHFSGVTGIKSFPDHLEIAGDVSLSHCDIEDFGSRRHFSGDLHLVNCLMMSALSEGTVVAGRLNMHASQIKRLPSRLQVGGDFQARNSALEEYPSDARIGGAVDLSMTNIVSLPDNLTVDGDLSLVGSSLAALPQGLRVNGQIDLSRTNVTRFAVGFASQGAILESLEIDTLAWMSVIDGNLSLKGSSVGSMPEDLEVGNNLYLDNAVLGSVPYRLRVGARIVTEGDFDLGELPDDTVVAGGVRIGVETVPLEALRASSPSPSPR
jgi:hypothetical protein